MPLPQEIQTERLLLRPPTEADALRMFKRYSSDPEVCRFLSWAPHRTVDDTIAYLRTTATNVGANPIERLLIFCRETGELLGSIGGPFEQHRVQFGYCLARDAWGRGYATEAARAFVATVMRDPAVWRLQAFCDVENRASARVLEKAGLTLEATLKRYMMMPNVSDQPRDMFLFAMVREHFPDAIG
jgi:[ribosomal protein S5]-alanine N-acetyltransferase